MEKEKERERELGGRVSVGHWLWKQFGKGMSEIKNVYKSLKGFIFKE